MTRGLSESISAKIMGYQLSQLFILESFTLILIDALILISTCNTGTHKEPVNVDLLEDLQRNVLHI